MSTVEIIMLITFSLLFILSMLKLKPFFSTKELKDDDRTPHSVELLYGYIFEVLESVLTDEKDITIEELFEMIITLESFDKEHFWRLNPNRIRLLINEFYIKNPQVKTLKEMYELHKQL